MAAQWRIQFEDLDFSEGLGTGSFGNVTKGTYSGAEVAIKCLPLDGDDILEKNLQRQMDTLIQLDHPNIVRIKGLCFGLADLPMSSRAKPLPTLLPNSGSCFAATERTARPDFKTIIARIEEIYETAPCTGAKP